jgi:hypothetical protein
MKRRVIESDESATSHADQMKSFERQIVHQRMKIVGRASRLWTGRGIGLAPAPPPPIERDYAITGLRECRDLRFPAFARASDGVHQHDRLTGTAAVGEPETHAGKRGRFTTKNWSFFKDLLRGRYNQTRDKDRDKPCGLPTARDQDLPPSTLMRSTTSS